MSCADTKHQDDMTELESLYQMVNMLDYPLDDKNSEIYKKAVLVCQQQLANDGCAHLPNLIREDKIELIREQSEAVSHLANFHENKVNPYATEGNPELSESHPVNRFQTFSNGFVAKDLMPESMIIKKLYANTIFQSFIADCLGKDKIYEYADPIAGLVINVNPENTTLPWHYDTNEFIVSLMILRPEEGGEFQYSPGIRQPGDENYEEVQKILDGDLTKVKSLTLNTGDLQLFMGRFSIHRVAPAKGKRLSTLFGYAEKPGMIGRIKRTKDVYGRVTDAHIEAEKQAREDGLAG
ncbi:hypothetical protein Q4508_10755 [Amphritea sp. 2_MG-2023]|uniref:HalD/BesD family halogenase n=1 Tax=Amphritea TaxID=515417 RepID=UPI001C068710|nr:MULTISPECIES: hypothetical protein [Amphritea]MBU2967550.1 hypothetical protein [Amphritea atlantica]MDO6419038.1 hypothetical protein [Amphritea sp. 2_MG-2023]